MIVLRNNYTFRYPQKKIESVKYITPGSKRYHIVPFVDKQVLLFWKEHPDIKPDGFNIDKIPYDDALYIGNLMNIPVVIVLGKDGDKYELYYIRNNPESIPKCPKRKHYTS